MTAALVLARWLLLIVAGWLVLAIVAALVLGPLLRRNQQRYPRAPRRLKPQDVVTLARWQEIDLPMTPDEERDLYRDYRRTAALQPGGLIVSRRA